MQLSIIKIISIFAFVVPAAVHSQKIPWNCANDANGVDFDVERASGVWFEAVRVPQSQVPACVQVNLPTAIANESYIMELNYINNVNKKWQPTTENLTFPWDESTQRGIFELQYGSGAVSMNFTFKLVATDYDNLAAICYYTNFSPSASMIKIMTRQQELNATIVNQIQKLADNYGFGEQITWVEQSSKCNDASMLVPGIAFLLVMSLIRRIF